MIVVAVVVSCYIVVVVVVVVPVAAAVHYGSVVLLVCLTCLPIIDWWFQDWWLGGVMVRALDLRSGSRRFDSRPDRYQAT